MMTFDPQEAERLADKLWEKWSGIHSLTDEAAAMLRAAAERVQELEHNCQTCAQDLYEAEKVVEAARELMDYEGAWGSKSAVFAALEQALQEYDRG